MKRIFLSIPFFLVLIYCANAQTYLPRQDYQWYNAISSVKGSGVPYTTHPYLWIPPGCQKLNSVLVTSTSIIEQLLIESPEIRAVFSRHGIAILWSHDFYTDDATAAGTVQTMLNALSATTGYPELKTVPWIIMGHSATLPMPRYLIQNSTSRIAMCILNKTNRTGCGTINTVPILLTQGEYVEWNSYSINLTANISNEPSYTDTRSNRSNYNQLLSYYFDPNTGHFDCSLPLIKNIAMWIDDTWDLRFDTNGNMIPIDISKGWITGMPIPGSYADKFQPIPYTNQSTATLTQGQVSCAPWFPSQRTAQAAYDMANISMTRTAQITGFANPADGDYDAKSYWWGTIMWNVPFTLGSNGHTVTLLTAPYYRMPNRSDYCNQDNIANKSFLNNTPNSFSNSGNPSQIEVQSGNLKQLTTNTFEYIPRFPTYNYLIVRQPGDATYRTSVQAAVVFMTPITGGSNNTITFNAISNQDLSSLNPITLSANSTAGVTVRYFVNSGPAHIVGNQLVFDKDSIPPKARFPFPVIVTAYHLGTASPLVNTATSVTRTFYILNGILSPINWFVAPTAVGTGDGTSWANAMTIQTALNSTPYGDNIFMKAGDYNLTGSLSVDSKVLNIYGGFAGNESQVYERQRIDLDNNGIVEPWEFTNKTRLVGGRYKATPSSFTAFKVIGGTAGNIRVDGISVEEGLGAPGGVNLSGTCIFTNSIVKNCRTYNALGDIYQSAGGIVSTVTDATIDGCLIENCEAQPSQQSAARAGQSRGGACYISSTIQNSVVRNNKQIYDMVQPAGNTFTPLQFNPYLLGCGINMTSKTAKVINCVINNNETRVIHWDAINYTATNLNSIIARGVGIYSEVGGSIINCTITNNKMVVKDLNGNEMTTTTGVWGVGVYLGNNNAATNNEAYCVNNVVWGNSAPGLLSTNAYQVMRLTINATNSATPPFFAFYNNVTPLEAVNATTATSSFYAKANNLINLAAVNTTSVTGPLFRSPSTFAGAVWGTTSTTSADSILSVSASNWSIPSDSYLTNKGKTSYAAAGSTVGITPTTDLLGNIRDISTPSVGAFESQYYTEIVPNFKNHRNNLQSVLVYRNMEQQIVVKVNSDINTENIISAYSITGQKLAEKYTKSNITVFNNLNERGIYFITVSNAINSITKKVIIN